MLRHTFYKSINCLGKPYDDANAHAPPMPLRHYTLVTPLILLRHYTLVTPLQPIDLGKVLKSHKFPPDV